MLFAKIKLSRNHQNYSINVYMYSPLEWLNVLCEVKDHLLANLCPSDTACLHRMVAALVVCLTDVRKFEKVRVW